MWTAKVQENFRRSTEKKIKSKDHGTNLVVQTTQSTKDFLFPLPED